MVWFINGFTFRAVDFGRSREVSINNIQEEISWVVVGLTGITSNTHHHTVKQIIQSDILTAI